MVRWINMARRTPLKFAERMDEMRKTHLSQDEKFWSPPPEMNPETEEILETHMPLMVPPQNNQSFDQSLEAVKTQPEMPHFQVSEGLCRAAQDHVADQFENGGSGHLGDDASNFRERCTRYGKSTGGLTEILIHGIDDPLGIAIWIAWNNYALQKNDRFAMFNPGLNFIGVACGGHPEMGSTAVILIAEDYVTDPDKLSQRPTQFAARFAAASKQGYVLRLGSSRATRSGKGCCVIV